MSIIKTFPVDAKIIALASSICYIAVISALVILWLKKYVRRNYRPKTIGFFHPRCHVYGGAEKVLWSLVAGCLNDRDDTIIYIYVDANYVCDEKTVEKAEVYYGLDLSKRFVKSSDKQLCDNESRIKFVHLKTVTNVFRCYRIFVVLRVTLAAFIASIEALYRVTPEFMIDSFGLACLLFIPSLLNVKTYLYIHEPIMLSQTLLAYRRAHPYLGLYHEFVRWLYNSSWLTAQKCIFNSLWTYNGHLSLLNLQKPTQDLQDLTAFQKYIYFLVNKILCHNIGSKAPGIYDSSRMSVVYPPVSLKHAREATSNPWHKRGNIITQIGQFRPQKNYLFTILAFNHLIKLKQTSPKLMDYIPDDLHLHLIGGIGSLTDQINLQDLRCEVKNLGLESRITFHVHISNEELSQILRKTKVGVHAQVNEPFGIAPAELLAGGVLLVAHNSGGPSVDILCCDTAEANPDPDSRYIRTKYGYLADTVRSFAGAIAACFNPKFAKENQQIFQNVQATGISRFPDNDKFAKDCLDFFRMES